MKLNVEKIKAELKRLNKNYSWLADKARVSPQRLFYWFKTANLRGAEPIGKVLKIAPRDLIK